MSNIKTVHRNELRLPEERYSVRQQTIPDRLTWCRDLLISATKGDRKWPFTTPLIVREKMVTITEPAKKKGGEATEKEIRIFEIGDGRHRFEAGEPWDGKLNGEKVTFKGWSEYPVEVRTYKSDLEFYQDQYALNQGSQQFSKGERERYIKTLKDTFNLTNEKIGEIIGLSKMSIGRILKHTQAVVAGGLRPRRKPTKRGPKLPTVRNTAPPNLKAFSAKEFFEYLTAMLTVVKRKRETLLKYAHGSPAAREVISGYLDLLTPMLMK